jgi:hypothetical protein
MQLFGVLSDDLRYLIHRQVKDETFQFMDMVQEYKGMLQGLKVIYTETQNWDYSLCEVDPNHVYMTMPLVAWI